MWKKVTNASELKEGDRVKFTNTEFPLFNGEYIYADNGYFKAKDGYYYHFVTSKNGFNLYGGAKFELFINEDTMFKKGDLLISESGYYRLILNVIDGLYFLSDWSKYSTSECLKEFGFIYTEFELNNNGFKLVTEPQVKEVSMNEVAEKFGVDVKNLKIKKD